MNSLNLALLLLTGVSIAILPLSLVWASKDTNKYRKLVGVTLFLTFDLIVFGAFTRLTDSGLGCPDWPGCYNHANPFQVSDAIHAAEALMPQGPVTAAKAWIEMIHRYLAGAIGSLILGLFLLALFQRYIAKRKLALSVSAPLGLLSLVIVQIVFGALTVTMKLQPIIVTTHLLLGLTLLGSLAWVHASYRDHSRVDPATARLRLFAAIMLFLLILQIALGGWVSTNYAALACPDFPLCQGKVIPDMDYANAYTLWRKLGQTGSGDYLAFPALTAIHWTHRLFAFLVLGVGIALARKLRSLKGMERSGYWLATLLVVQILIGISTVFLQWPLLLAVAHTGGAALLVCVMVMINYKAWAAARLRTSPAPDSLS